MLEITVVLLLFNQWRCEEARHTINPDIIARIPSTAPPMNMKSHFASAASAFFFATSLAVGEVEPVVTPAARTIAFGSWVGNIDSMNCSIYASQSVVDHKVNSLAEPMDRY